MQTDVIRLDCIVALFQDASKVSFFLSEVSRVLPNLPSNVRLNVIFVNDGSDDEPKIEIEKSKFNFEVQLIELSRNFGKEAAITAGLHASSGDACVLIDVDLQDPIELIPRMVKEWLTKKSDVVLPIRNPKVGERGIRRRLSRMYLKILRVISGVNFHPGAGETRLMSRNVVETLRKFQETQRFMRGLMTWVGYETSYISFERKSSSDKSRFSYLKLFRLAIDGILSFSLAPLRFVTLLGFTTLLLSVLTAFFVIYLRLTDRIILPGFSSTMLLILITSSIQVVSLGLIGEYLGRTLLESKRRPIFIVMDISAWRSNTPD